MQAAKQATPRTVLVVEDEPYLREMVIEDLVSAGYQTLEAASGNDAIKLLEERAEDVDLIVSDIRMPNGTGVQLLKWVRSRHPSEPGLVFMTGFADIGTEEALSMGAEAFLRKPVDHEEMLATVKDALVPKGVRWLAPLSDYAGALPLHGTQDGFGGLALEAPPAVEIGQGGMFVVMEDGFPNSLEVVRFSIPQPLEHTAQPPLEGVGLVRWVRYRRDRDLSAGIGIEFLSLTEATRHALSVYLGSTKPVAFIPLGRLPASV